MKRWWIIPENLELFRGPGRCSWCGKQCKNREPHHIFAKGMGGNKPPGDSRINLIALGATQSFECPCHTFIHSQHDPKEARIMLWKLVAAREGIEDWRTIRNANMRLALCTKDTTLEDLQEKGLLKWVRGGFGNGGLKNANVARGL